MIKIADYGYALGSGGPDGKSDAGYAVHFTQVGTHFFMGLTVVALIEEINGVLGKTRKKTVGVVELTDLSVVALDSQAIVEAFATRLDEALEKAVSTDSLQWIAGAVGYGDVDYLADLGVVDKSANNQCAFAGGFAGVHTQNRVRLAAGHLGD